MICFASIFAFLLLLPSLAFAQPPGIHAPTGQGSPLQWNDDAGFWTGGFNAVSTAADWNNDGYIDLMVHYAVGGGAKNTMWGTYLYLHSTAKDNSGNSIFEAPKRMPFDGKPLAWDWNHDGWVDCLTDDKVYLNQQGEPFHESIALILPPNATCIADWNGDGLPDLFCPEPLERHVFPTQNMAPTGTPPYTPDGIWKGNADRRSVRWFMGSNLDDVVRWQDQGLITVNGEPIEFFGGGHSSLGDWDLDGDLDLVVGAQTELIYYQNVGVAKSPTLSQGHLVKVGTQYDVPGLFCRPTVYQPSLTAMPQLFLAQENGDVTWLPFQEIDPRGIPSFEKEKQLMQKNAFLDAGCLAAISVVDWDGDLDLDIISGNSYGDVLLFENSGTRDEPLFSSKKYVESDHHPISIKAGANGSIQGPGEAHFGYTAPVAVDWNDDKIMDLILTGVWGKYHYYYGSPVSDSLLSPDPIKVSGRDQSEFMPPWVWWKTRFGELVTQWRCQPAVVDWNMDATYDIVTLDSEGYLTYFMAFKSYPTPYLREPFHAFFYENGEPIRITNGVNGKSGRARVVFADWDGDHDLDIIRGCTTAGGHITPNGKNDERVAVWYENTNDDLHFIYRGNLIGDVSVSFAGHATSPAIVDWDNDGKLDLLLGTEDGLIYYFDRDYIESTFN